MKQEPDIKMNKNTLNFIDQLENNLVEDNQKRGHSTIKTKYDMKSPQNKILTTMHEALSKISKFIPKIMNDFIFILTLEIIKRCFKLRREPRRRRKHVVH